ncbi:MAG: tRNA pseudouridine(38-40) synthase TruA [Clostridiales bacterium]|nr:tRNA pseudouridine(38-40) synthase TruA [Clostridiales bacterium]
MRNIMLEIEYDGTDFNGWQIQPKGRTVEKEIMKVIKRITKHEVKIFGASRTDAKVHARGQTANFMTESKIPIDRLPKAMNGLLPKDVSIIKAFEMPKNFHARYHAIGKTYSYHIYNSGIKSALLSRYSYYYPVTLDIELMRAATQFLIGVHDFKSFMSANSNIRNTVRTINSIDICKRDKSIYLTFEGNGFLYNMVRIMVGTLLEIGRKKIVPEQMKYILESKNRVYAGCTAVPQGLFLEKVIYP